MRIVKDDAVTDGKKTYLCGHCGEIAYHKSDTIEITESGFNEIFTHWAEYHHVSGLEYVHGVRKKYISPTNYLHDLITLKETK